MIVDDAGRAATPPVPEEGVAAALQEAFAGCDWPLEWDSEREGLDLRLANEVATGPNRARLKLWSPRAGTVLVFVYKDSVLDFSEDRFAYGAWILKGKEAVDPAAFEALMSYAGEGLHPDKRPAFLKRAFPFTVPR